MVPSNETENTALTGEEGYESYESEEADASSPGGKESGLPGLCFCCCCCCLCVILPMCFSIAAAVNSRGYTSCSPTSPPLVNNTAIPNFHTISTPQHQWNNFFFHESSVFDPQISNETRIGYWRTTKTWYLRGQWAYVVEGTTVPAIIAWTPYFSWYRTHNVQLCNPAEEYVVQQRVWSGWTWGQDTVKWEISTGGLPVATATHVKEHQWWGFQIPNGWQTSVTSNQLGGLSIADMIQTYDSMWVRNSLWYVKDHRPDLLGSWVVSFLAVAEDEKSHGGSDTGRRLRPQPDEGPSKEDLLQV